jgi:hypothetical protein
VWAIALELMGLRSEPPEDRSLSSRRGGGTSGLDLTSAATMQHPWLISRPDMPGCVQVVLGP